MRQLLVPIALFTFAAEARVLQIGIGGEPVTLDPHHFSLPQEQTILNDLFLGLTTCDAEGEIVPGVAQRWTASEDGLTWMFELRRNAKWSDGRQVTAHDFVFAFRRLLDPETGAHLAHFLYPIRNAEAVNAGELPVDAMGARADGDHALVIELAHPFPFLAERLAHPAAYPLPALLVQERGDAWVEPGTMVSNGAFVLEDREPWALVRLGRNPAFQDADSVAIEGVAYHPIGDANAAYYQYRAGELDAIGEFPRGEIAWVREHMPDHLRTSPQLSVTYLVFNAGAAPFDDPRVREALSIVLHRPRIVSEAMGSDAVEVVSLVPPAVTRYASAIALVEDRESRLDRARRLLRDAGYGESDPLAVTLRHVSGPEAQQSSVAIAQAWKEIDVETTLHEVDREAHFQDLRRGNFQVAHARWFGENNPEHYLAFLLSDGGRANYGRFDSRAFDTLMRRARAEPSLTRRVDLLRDAEVVALAAFPLAPLYSMETCALVNPRISGWHENPRDLQGARYLSWEDERPSGTPDPGSEPSN